MERWTVGKSVSESSNSDGAWTEQCSLPSLSGDVCSCDRLSRSSNFILYG